MTLNPVPPSPDASYVCWAVHHLWAGFEAAEIVYVYRGLVYRLGETKTNIRILLPGGRLLRGLSAVLIREL